MSRAARQPRERHPFKVFLSASVSVRRAGLAREWHRHGHSRTVEVWATDAADARRQAETQLRALVNIEGAAS